MTIRDPRNSVSKQGIEPQSLAFWTSVINTRPLRTRDAFQAQRSHLPPKCKSGSNWWRLTMRKILCLDGESSVIASRVSVITARQPWITDLCYTNTIGWGKKDKITYLLHKIIAQYIWLLKLSMVLILDEVTFPNGSMFY